MNKDTAIIDGWFKAPETGKYRFYISGDDVTQLYFKRTPFDVDEISQEKPDFNNDDMIASRQRYSKWRQYFNEVPQTQNERSEWISLTQGKFYPIQAFLQETTGGDHLTVAVEF
jgi:hypothetical protein